MFILNYEFFSFYIFLFAIKYSLFANVSTFVAHKNNSNAKYLTQVKRALARARIFAAHTSERDVRTHIRVYFRGVVARFSSNSSHIRSVAHIKCACFVRTSVSASTLYTSDAHFIAREQLVARKDSRRNIQSKLSCVIIYNYT